MKEIIMPQISTSQTDSLPGGYTKYAVPDTLQEKDRIELFNDQVQAVVQKIIELEQSVEKYKGEVSEFSLEIKNQTNRNIEIIGLFSSVLALLIINVSVLTNVNSFFTSMMLIVALTSSISIFSILIHTFFNLDTKPKFTKHFWIPFSILISLLIFSLLAFLFDLKLG